MVHGLRRHGDDAAALREPVGHLRVLQRQEHEDGQRHEDEEPGEGPDASVEDTRDVIDGGADVGEDYGPAENRADRSFSASFPVVNCCVYPHDLDASKIENSIYFRVCRDPVGFTAGSDPIPHPSAQ